MLVDTVILLRGIALVAALWLHVRDGVVVKSLLGTLRDSHSWTETALEAMDRHIDMLIVVLSSREFTLFYIAASLYKGIRYIVGEMGITTVSYYCVWVPIARRQMKVICYIRQGPFTFFDESYSLPNLVTHTTLIGMTFPVYFGILQLRRCTYKSSMYIAIVILY